MENWLLLNQNNVTLLLNPFITEQSSTCKEDNICFILYWKFNTCIIADKYSRVVCYSWSLTSQFTATCTLYSGRIIGWNLLVTNSNSAPDEYACLDLRLHLHCEWKSVQTFYDVKGNWKDQCIHIPPGSVTLTKKVISQWLACVELFNNNCIVIWFKKAIYMNYNREDIHLKLGWHILLATTVSYTIG